MARLTSDFFVKALLRRAMSEGAYGLIARRGASEAGAIFILIDRLDGTVALYQPAPQSMMEDPGERRFMRAHDGPTQTREEAEALIERETRFDSDLWLVELEDRQGRILFDTLERS